MEYSIKILLLLLPDNHITTLPHMGTKLETETHVPVRNYTSCDKPAFPVFATDITVNTPTRKCAYECV